MSYPIPDISQNGYELCTVAQFKERATSAHIKRFERDVGYGKGRFIIWDPNDDDHGFMVCADTIAELNREFLSYFDGFLS